MVLNRDTHERLIHSLSSWHFEPHKLPEEEVIACSYILFEALYRIENMQETVSVSLGECPFHAYVPYHIVPSIPLNGVRGSNTRLIGVSESMASHSSSDTTVGSTNHCKRPRAMNHILCLNDAWWTSPPASPANVHPYLEGEYLLDLHGHALMTRIRTLRMRGTGALRRARYRATFSLALTQSNAPSACWVHTHMAGAGH